MAVNRMFTFDPGSPGYEWQTLSDWASKLNNYLLPYVVSVTTTYTAKTNDHTIEADASGGAFSINLPAASSCLGLTLNIIKIDASANAVTLDPNGAETVGGVATRALATQWAELTVQSNGVSWDVLSFVPFTSAGVLPTTAGGTGLGSYAAGDMLYYASGAAFSKLAFVANSVLTTSAASPPAWSSHITYGMLPSGGGTWANGGALSITGGSVTFGSQTLGPDGLVGAPSYAFTNDPDSGLYRYGSNAVGLAAGGVLTFYGDVTGGQYYGNAGGAGVPPFGFLADPDTGMYNYGANQLAFSTAGGLRVYINSTVLQCVGVDVELTSNNKFYKGYTVAAAVKKLIGVNASDKVDIDTDALGSVFGDSIQAASLVSFSKTVSNNQTIPAGYSCVVAQSLTIASGKTLTLGLNASLAIVA